MTTFDATYSPEDNKLRLYASSRLDAKTYADAKKHGFRWAPKQELFVAPAWTPSRETFLLNLCGEIGDEDTSLVDRAETRAERFDTYSNKRATDAQRASDGVKAITDGIPMGQPILVGHHSEKHARRDAQRIENGMRKAIKMWETSEYWQYRAAGAIRHSKYKELPVVRARRIKKIEADKRKSERIIKNAEKLLKLWHGADSMKRKDGTPLTFLEGATAVANYFDHLSGSFPLDKYPRQPPASQYEGSMSLWSALDGGVITPEQAREMAIRSHERRIPHAERWLAHENNRLTYEKAMLDEQGGTDLLKPKPRKKLLPLCNYRAADGIDVMNIYNRGETIHMPQIEMTKAEYAKICSDYKGARPVENSHRVRTTMRKFSLYSVFLTDSKTHPKPEAIEDTPREIAPPRIAAAQPAQRPERTEADAMRESLKQGIEVVAAPQLFPTPRDLAQRMADEADIQPGHKVLEPSAGTGMLIGAMGYRMFTGLPRDEGHPMHDKQGQIVAVEINHSLAGNLKREFPKTEVICSDFLQFDSHLPGTRKFDRIIMNPPFANGADIKHIKHAATMLAPGGVLVALCADGPRQAKQLEPMADLWEPLPADTFKKQGTGVNIVLLTIKAS